MNTTVDDRLEAALDALPHRHQGPGGVAGAIIEGRVIAARAWGYADLVARLQMVTATRLPICSISKQFTCGVLLDRVGDLETLDDRVAEFLPAFQDRLSTVTQLCHNQSGLRD